MNLLSKLLKIQFIFLIGLLCSVISLRSQTLRKYDYKNFVVNEEKYFAIPFCYLGKFGEFQSNPLELIDYVQLYNAISIKPTAPPAFDLKELLNYNSYFDIKNIWHLWSLEVITGRPQSIDGPYFPSEDYKLWTNQFIGFIKSNSTNFSPTPSYIIRIGNTDNQVTVYSPNRIQIPVSEIIQRGIKSYKRFVPIYDFFIIKCKINYISQDSVNIFMPIISPKRRDIRNNLFFMSPSFYIPFNIAGRTKLDQMFTFHHFNSGYSSDDILRVFKNKGNALKKFKYEYKGNAPEPFKNLTIHNYQNQIEYLFEYKSSPSDFLNSEYIISHDYSFVLKTADSCNKNRVNIFAPQIVKENIIVSILEFSIPTEQEIIRFISQLE